MKNTITRNGEYLAPSIKVLEVKTRKVLCGSGGIDSMRVENTIDGDNFFDN